MSPRRSVDRTTRVQTPHPDRRNSAASATRESRQSRPRRRRAIAWFLAGLLAVVIVAAGGTWTVWPRAHAAPQTAVLVDQLGLTFADVGFVHQATATLQRAGYSVDYVPPRAVTVPYYQQLGLGGYGLVILRVHTPRLGLPNGTLGDDVSLLTSETYSTAAYVPEQLARLIAPGRMLDESEHPEPLFTVTDQFVRSSMAGSFGGATVVLMGCSTLRANTLASAFLARGASEVVGWDDDVSGEYTDRATEVLLQHLVEGKLTPSAAVARTMSEVGPDPLYGSKLIAYPA